MSCARSLFTRIGHVNTLTKVEHIGSFLLEFGILVLFTSVGHVSNFTKVEHVSTFYLSCARSLFTRIGYVSTFY